MGETHVGACNYKATRLEGHTGHRRRRRGRERGRGGTRDGPASANAINFAEKYAGGRENVEKVT